MRHVNNVEMIDRGESDDMMEIFRKLDKSNMPTVVEVDSKVPFLIPSTRKCKGGR